MGWVHKGRHVECNIALTQRRLSSGGNQIRDPCNPVPLFTGCEIKVRGKMRPKKEINDHRCQMFWLAKVYPLRLSSDRMRIRSPTEITRGIRAKCAE